MMLMHLRRSVQRGRLHKQSPPLNRCGCRQPGSGYEPGDIAQGAEYQRQHGDAAFRPPCEDPSLVHLRRSTFWSGRRSSSALGGLFWPSLLHRVLSRVESYPMGYYCWCGSGWQHRKLFRGPFDPPCVPEKRRFLMIPMIEVTW
jgi:hypothetical protein